LATDGLATGVLVPPTEDDEPDSYNDLTTIYGYLGNLKVLESPPVPSQVSSQQSTNPTNNALNNHYVRVVHVNGVHHIALVTCNCQGADNVHVDLMYTQLLPTTFTHYKTLFTVAVLDDYRLSNLECKASTYQYYQKICWLTCPMAPTTTPHLYQELMRLSQVWRWLKKLKWAGYGHKSRDLNQSENLQEPISSGLGNFCPACPQPGINLPLDWKNDPNRYIKSFIAPEMFNETIDRWVYQRFFVADSNFKADHVQQKNMLDVWLYQGTGMMTKRDEYKLFLDTATECRTVCESALYAG